MGIANALGERVAECDVSGEHHTLNFAHAESLRRAAALLIDDSTSAVRPMFAVM
jgi:hypothetical protein